VKSDVGEIVRRLTERQKRTLVGIDDAERRRMLPRGPGHKSHGPVNALVALGLVLRADGGKSFTTTKGRDVATAIKAHWKSQSQSRAGGDTSRKLGEP
jgi:hypothetical protein